MKPAQKPSIRGTQMQPSTARPLGTKKDPKKKVDTSASNVVSFQRGAQEAAIQPAAVPDQTVTEARGPQEKTMTLTQKGLSKNGKNAFYSGAATTLRFALSAFPNKTAPTTIEVPDGVFAQVAPKLTKEERKAARAAKPKATLAEKIAQREAALARLKAKEAAAAQPSL